MSGVNRQTVDLSKYPDLVVIYLGMRMNMLRGLKTMIGFGPRIQQSVDAKPEGLLLHENLLFSLFPPHRHAPVLARFRIPRAVDALGTASHLVAELPERLRGNRILARDLFHAGWDGSHIRRHQSFCRHDALRGAKTGARSNVWRPRSFRPDG